MNYNFPVAKIFANPHTPHALFPHTTSLSDALSSSTLLCKSLSIEVNDDTSEFELL